MFSTTSPAQHDDPAAPLRSVSVWPVVVMAVFLALQLALPASRLLQDTRPARWGWQMYSGYGANSVDYWVVTRDGRVAEVSPRDYLVTYRGDLRMERYLPQHICRTTDVREVQFSIEQGALRRLSCD